MDGFTAQEEALYFLGRALQQADYAFITITPATHARVLQNRTGRWAQTLRDVFGWSLPFRDGLLPAEMHARLSAAGWVTRQEGGWRSLVRASTFGTAVYLHSAYPTDDAAAVFFGPDTYRFAAALQQELAGSALAERVADLGCGGGAGAIMVAGLCPQADVLMVDINATALTFAKVNAALGGVAHARSLISDLLTSATGAFDLIIANPPYLNDGQERAYRHGGGPTGAALSLRIVKESIERLAPQGRLVLYTGSAVIDGRDGFREEAAALLRQAGMSFRYREIDPDVFGEELEQPAYAGVERIAAVLLTATQV